MSDETTVKAVDEPRALPAKTRFFHSPRWLKFRRGFKELLIVFSGVYAAFILNRADSDRRDTRRRVQILDALEREVRAKVDDLKPEVDNGAVELAEFDRRLAAGEMPSLAIQYSNASYNPNGDATLLQAGGLELVDVQTLELLRKVSALERTVSAITHDQFEMELTILGMHEGGEFYDPATRQLKSHYRWYPVVLHHLLSNAQALLAAEQELLTRIQDRHRPGEH